jgi:tRNA (guanine-N7-)-methyltransferase
MVVVRVRQHVNPLSQKYQGSVPPPAWEKIYAEPGQPLHLDIGCAKGQFLRQMAQMRPEWNFLGLEIRQSLVAQANLWRHELGLTNLYYLFCNANPSLRLLLQPESLQGVTIQFPDPWFKRRHQKRRLVQPELVRDLATCIRVGGFLFIQSDVEMVAEEMRDRLTAHPAFMMQGDPESWLPENPLPVATERELATLALGQTVYRALFLRR